MEPIEKYESAAPSRVRDRALAEMLAVIADEWEALNPHGRERLRQRFDAAFPDWGGAELRRIGWLGWRAVDSVSETRPARSDDASA